MDNLDLSSFFNTKPQAQDFSTRLAGIAQKIFETSFNPEAALLDQFGIEKKDDFMVLMRNNNVNGQSRKAIKEFIDAIQSKISSLPVLSIVMAFEPKDKTLRVLSQWFIVNTKKQMLFEIKVDPTIVGGAAMYVGGQYLDYSIKPKFDNIVNEILYGVKSAAPVAAEVKGAVQ